MNRCVDMLQEMECPTNIAMTASMFMHPAPDQKNAINDMFFHHNDIVDTWNAKYDKITTKHVIDQMKKISGDTNPDMNILKMINHFIRKTDMKYFDYICEKKQMFDIICDKNRVLIIVGKKQAVFDIVCRPETLDHYSYWNDNTTQNIVKYAEISGKTEPNILEAGSADGNSINQTKLTLGEFGIYPNITCIDKTDYSRHINKLGLKFIHGDILKTTPDKKYDIVNVQLLYNEDKKTIVRKLRACMKWMKDDGAMIAWKKSMLNGYTRLYDMNEIKEFCSYVEKMTKKEKRWINTIEMVYRTLVENDSIPPAHPMDEIVGIKRTPLPYFLKN